MEDVIHKYVKKPENIRQIGETSYMGPIYIEDYVMTYIRQIFKEESEEKIILMLGRKGEELAKGSLFIYGAVGMEFKVTDAVTDISEKQWSEAYEKIYKYFPGTEVMGFVCGVYMWNSKVDATINIIQKKYFSKEDNILFLFDLSECEEKIFKWHDGNLKEEKGYYVYYEKNPQMQEFVLGENENESVDDTYEDTVTEAIRETVNKNEQKTNSGKTVMCMMTMAIAVMFVVGGNYMLESFSKINSLENSVDVLQGYVETTYGNGYSKGTTVSGIETDNKSSRKKTEKSKTALNNGNKIRQNVVKTQKNNTMKKERAPKIKMPMKNNTNEMKEESKSGYETYKVKKGDTLSQIVWRQYHTLDKVPMVKRTNKIKNSDKIVAGQVIKLPVR